MHPYDHARSSAKIHGGCWSDFFQFHTWFDSTKAIQCRFTHRALRHHLQGVEEAILLFGATIANGDGIAVDTRTLGLQHLEEDCGMIPSASDWLLGFQRPDWLRSVNIDAEELAQDSARRFGGDASLYLPLHGWFLATSSWCDGIEHLLFRHHSFGVFEAETRFGPILQSDSGTPVPTRIVAERHVQTVVGSIPPAIDVLRRIKAERWMLQATSPRKLGLD